MFNIFKTIIDNFSIIKKIVVALYKLIDEFFLILFNFLIFIFVRKNVVNNFKIYNNITQSNNKIFKHNEILI